MVSPPLHQPSCRNIWNLILNSLSGDLLLLDATRENVMPFRPTPRKVGLFSYMNTRPIPARRKHRHDGARDTVRSSRCRQTCYETARTG